MLVSLISISYDSVSLTCYPRYRRLTRLRWLKQNLALQFNSSMTTLLVIAHSLKSSSHIKQYSNSLQLLKKLQIPAWDPVSLLAFTLLSSTNSVRLVGQSAKPIERKGFTKLDDRASYYIIPIVSNPLFPQFKGSKGTKAISVVRSKDQVG